MAAAILAAYIFVALAPFRWNPPRLVKNGAELTDRRTIRFSSPGVTETRATPEWLEQAIRHNSLTVRLRARSFSSDQSGPARLFTVSRTCGLRNLTIAQDGKGLVVRVRTPDTNSNGIPAITVPNIFASLQWREIEVSIASGSLAIFVDGEQVVDQHIHKAPFQVWNNQFLLALGNELTRNRPWLGEIAVAEVRVNDKQWECLSPETMETSPYLSNGLKFQWLTPGLDRLRFASSTDKPWLPYTVLFKDAGLNFICFVPFGLSVAMMKNSRWINAAIFCSLISLSVESTQLFFDLRMPSFSDWLTNSLGAFTGAFYASRLKIADAAS